MWLILLILIGSFQLTSTPKFCTSCHELNPEYVTWQASSHNKLACTECHVKSGAKNLLVNKVDSLQQVYKHLRKQYLLPLQTPEPLPDSVCTRCHDMNNRVVTPSGDIIIPHDKHKAQGVQCVACHSGVAHGKIALRQQTIDGDFERWTAAMGQAQMLSEFRVTGMKQCMECHKEKKVANTCETCHIEITTPPNHKTFAWVNLGEHGRDALANIDSCDRCHSFSKELEIIPGVSKAAEYARTNTYCYACHKKKPYAHNEAWKSNHYTPAGGDGVQGCLVCHSEKAGKKTDKAVKTYCQKCHKSQHQFFSPELHPVRLQPGTKLSSACSGCHSGRTCGTCHYLPGKNKSATGSTPGKPGEGAKPRLEEDGP